MSEQFSKAYFENLVSTVSESMVQVISNPVGFYQSMARSGGYVDPLVFAIIMGVLGGILQAVLHMFGIGFGGTVLMALASVVLVPIMTAFLGFVGAAILFMIWKFLGSQESYEVAYRCGAYATAITPVTALLSIIPFIGPLLGIAWLSYLMIVASVHVHQVKPKTALIAFAALGGVLIVLSISSQFAARKVEKQMGKFQSDMSKFDSMNPEEKGKAIGEFLKGMQQGMDKK